MLCELSIEVLHHEKYLLHGSSIYLLYDQTVLVEKKCVSRALSHLRQSPWINLFVFQILYNLNIKQELIGLALSICAIIDNL